MGVRNSWEILEKKIVLARSSSAKAYTQQTPVSLRLTRYFAEQFLLLIACDTSTRLRSSSIAMALATAVATWPATRLKNILLIQNTLIRKQRQDDN